MLSRIRAFFDVQAIILLGYSTFRFTGSYGGRRHEHFLELWVSLSFGATVLPGFRGIPFVLPSGPVHGVWNRVQLTCTLEVLEGMKSYGNSHQLQAETNRLCKVE